MNLMIILPSMRGGGSEKVILTLLQNLDRNKYNITLVLVRKEGKYLSFIPSDIKIIDLNLNSAKKGILKIAATIRQNKPDIVFSTLGYMNLLLSIIKHISPNKIFFIARESSIVSVNNKEERFTGLFNFLYRHCYSTLDLIICQSKYMKDDLMDNFNISSEKLIVINNPVDMETIHNKASMEDQKVLFNANVINLLAVGRLNKVKGYDKLIESVSLLGRNYHLTIIGEGDEKKYLTKLVEKLKLGNRVTFLGFDNNPYKYMKQADVLVLSSQYEGFPNVILEANACGTPVVAFQCPGGVVEIIENGVNGFLVEDQNIKMLTTTIEKAVKFDFDEQIIKHLTYKRYALKQQIRKYETIFESLKL